MDLVDVLDSQCDLLQDKWTITNPSFGNNNQVRVVGWSGKNNQGEKLYILKCSECAKDPELFGEGYFKSRKTHLMGSATLPCGCATSPRWTKQQYVVLCRRIAQGSGYKFIDFAEEWKGVYTKISVMCNRHGEWHSASIHTFINHAAGCPLCGRDVIKLAAMKPDEEMINSFFASGAFHPDTKFWRSARKDNRGWQRYWYLLCPECNQLGESISGNLQKGKLPCACSLMRQQEAYINLIFDDELVIAVKFGISRNSDLRLATQNYKTRYDIRQHSAYEFSDVISCKAAERQCKQELVTGVMSKYDMPDGYTETTYVYNIDKIIEIYERNGGVRLEQPRLSGTIQQWRVATENEDYEE